MERSWAVACGHMLDVLRLIPSESVQCCVTSPPYYMKRYYDAPDAIWPSSRKKPCDGAHRWRYFVRRGADGGVNKTSAGKGRPNYMAIPDQRQALCSACGAWLGQLGLEPSSQEYIDHLVAAFREVRRVLRRDGVLFLNLSDTYYHTSRRNHSEVEWCPDGGYAKPYDVLGIPYRVAMALRRDGWIWRDVVVWAKGYSGYEGDTAVHRGTIGGLPKPSRFAATWEPVLMLTKSREYFFDPRATGSGLTRSVLFLRISQDRSSHVAPFPADLAKMLIVSATRQEDVVLDPFAGTCSVGVAALSLGRRFVGVDVSPTYVSEARASLESLEKVLLDNGAFSVAT